MNRYKFIFIMIFLFVGILVILKYYSIETFVQSNGKCIQYNVYAEHKIEPKDNLPSS